MEKHESEIRIKQMAAVAAAGIGAVSLGAANLPQPVNAATNDVQVSSSQDDLKTAQENVKTAKAENTQAALIAEEADLAEKKEALATATAKAAATLHALNLAKARLAASEATQPTDRSQRLQLNRLPSRPKNLLQNQPLKNILKNQLIRKKILTAVTL
ncbi:hypothetical protein [Lactobacillus delbrueckii]|uniref:hypothetical protein n=1 Tax=Lactobacillus delbrueckii TaxID=1584 RepID=UPI001E3FFF2E|nr:hypothetical protein [Lactobacillus delbrueckii subsp. lactis]MCD5484794.1 hypothetical protein [Lactobacillus delbrueckii subsp. lactis]